MGLLFRGARSGAWAFVCLTGACSSDPASSLPDEPEPESVSSRYLTEFGVLVPHPVVHACPGASYRTTVAYLPTGFPQTRMMYVMHLTLDGSDLATSRDGNSRYFRQVNTPPAGTFRVLTAVLLWPQTFTSAELPLLEAAQAVINQQHADFATSRGYAAPIVRFEFTNVTVPGPDAYAPKHPVLMLQLLAGQGVDTSGYDFFAVINIDPSRTEGGFVGLAESRPYPIYMGNYGVFTQRLTAAQVENVANAVYHHEVGHHWGWAHDWLSSCGSPAPFAPFITAPVLYGWEDTDGDGIPEILDSSPYDR